MIPFSMSVLDSKTNAPSSTYSMHNRSNRTPDKKVPGPWLTSYPVDIGELSLRENWALLSHRTVHLSSSVLENTIINNRNITRDMLYPCLEGTLKWIDVYTLPIMRLTMILLYLCLIADHSIGGAPYFTNMTMTSAWLEVSKDLTKSANDTHVGRLWLCLRCRMISIVNVPYCRPTPGVDPNWNFTPCLLIILNSRPHMILL